MAGWADDTCRPLHWASCMWGAEVSANFLTLCATGGGKGRVIFLYSQGVRGRVACTLVAIAPWHPYCALLVSWFFVSALERVHAPADVAQEELLCRSITKTLSTSAMRRRAPASRSW